MTYHQLISGFGILNRTFLKYISTAIADRDISYSDSIFLANIGNQEGINQETIANRLAIDTAAIARSVKHMKQKGYVITKPSQEDRRVKALYLTDSGKALFEFIQQLNHEWVDDVLADLESEQVEQFAQIIASITERAKTKAG